MISVCMATYNGERYIETQLRSILSQLSADDEVIVSDDGSTDGTRNVVQRVMVEYPVAVRIVDGPRRGVVANFEYALTLARGEYIFLSDQDDVWKPEKVQTMLRALQGEYLVVSDCTVTDETLRETAPSFYRLNKTRTGFWYNLLVINGYLGCCMAMQRCVVEKALPFPHKTPMHDIWLGNVAARYFRVCFLPAALIYFRRHRHNASATAGRSHASMWQRLGYRLTMLWSILFCK